MTGITRCANDLHIPSHSCFAHLNSGEFPGELKEASVFTKGGEAALSLQAPDAPMTPLRSHAIHLERRSEAGTNKVSIHGIFMIP